MKKCIIAFSVLAFLLVGSCIGNLIFYGFWGQEKELRVQAESALKKANEQLKISEGNIPERLTKVSRKFIKAVFSGNAKNLEDRKKRLRHICTKEVLKQIFKKKQVNEVKTVISSSAKIEDAVYNRIGKDDGKVIMKVEQTLKTEQREEKTLQEVVVYLKCVDKDWKVFGFEVKGLI